jgi:hypothetical protein
MQHEGIFWNVDEGLPPGSLQHRVQRAVLLEVVSWPPKEGDDLTAMAARLRHSLRDVEIAVDSLAEVGLVSRRGKRVWGTRAAMRFDVLWPIYWTVGPVDD